MKINRQSDAFIAFSLHDKKQNIIINCFLFLNIFNNKKTNQISDDKIFAFTETKTRI